MIAIGKKWEPGTIDITRTSILGNPFYLKNIHDNDQRNLVCDKYHAWFKQKLRETDSDFVKELFRLFKLAKSQDIILGCYCAPKRCHGETIKKFLEQMLDGTFNYEKF